MDIYLSENLKKLRKERGYTQEDLANFLGMSAQAVSKWERNEGFPDITLLPKIAGYYHITVDGLLGVDELSKQTRIAEITKEYNTMRHHIPLDKNYKLDEGIAFIRNALKELPGVFFFEQLLAADLSWKGKQTEDISEKEELYREAILLCEDIRAHSHEDRWRDCANQILLVIYADMGEDTKALELAYQMPTPRCTCEYMLTYILKGDELIKQYRLNGILFYQLFRESILKMNESAMSPEEMLHPREISLADIDTNEYLTAIKQIITD